MADLKGKDILTVDQFTTEEVELILDVAAYFDKALANREKLNHMQGLVLATLFFEPSTRTRLSFETAMLRLGGSVITVADPQSSSVAKGETLADTIKTIEAYADVIVLRHPRIGSAHEAAAVTERPIINAGDGAGEHPTQALLDLYTIKKELGRIQGITVALVGDLKYGRTVHSLSKALSLFKDIKLLLVSPEALQIPQELREYLRQRNIEFEETSDLTTALKQADIIYMTRIQKERFEDITQYERLKGIYKLTLPLIEKSHKNLVIMHPLPRVDEIDPEVDAYPGAAYFRQVKNGVSVRMALLTLICGRLP
jgi:aspartate carbamoyltransferase catalytic subunit